MRLQVFLSRNGVCSRRKAFDLVMSGHVSVNGRPVAEPSTPVDPGKDRICVDGKAVPYSEYENSGKQAIAVVFHTYSDGETEGNGYAVYLWDMTPKAFADSLGVEQGTSADIAAYDGNENTFALYDTEETASPMAEAVFALWKYGQSAYIPSVAQMRLLYSAQTVINPIIEKCGGDPLPTEADVDKAFDYLERMLDKLHERIEKFEKKHAHGDGTAL